MAKTALSLDWKEVRPEAKLVRPEVRPEAHPEATLVLGAVQGPVQVEEEKVQTFLSKGRLEITERWRRRRRRRDVLLCWRGVRREKGAKKARAVLHAALHTAGLCCWEGRASIWEARPTLEGGRKKTGGKQREQREHAAGAGATQGRRRRASMRVLRRGRHVVEEEKEEAKIERREEERDTEEEGR